VATDVRRVTLSTGLAGVEFEVPDWLSWPAFAAWTGGRVGVITVNGGAASDVPDWPPTRIAALAPAMLTPGDVGGGGGGGGGK
jgi:hypothetical protein